ncbi:hypothetical protein MP228_010863 [Amoeboaphelidium protococcarum]|nr:hypothetical protein MP228_010863 [Amoeboaphelidium protococcarum]
MVRFNRSNSTATLMRTIDEVEQAESQIPSNVTRNQEGAMRMAWLMWRIVCAIVLLYSIAVIVIGSMVYMRYHASTCVPQLSTWLLVQLIIQGIVVVVNCAMLCVIPSIYDDPITAMRKSYKCGWVFIITRLIPLAYAVWTIVGISFTALPQEIANCQSEDQIDYIRGFCVLLVFIHSAIFIFMGTMASCVPCIVALFMAYEQGYDYMEQRGVSLPSHSRRSLQQQQLQQLLSRGQQSSFQELQRYMIPVNITGDKSLHGCVCAICQCDLITQEEHSVADQSHHFSNTDRLWQLQCGHIYHESCISQSVTLHSRHCPTCRQSIVTPNQISQTSLDGSLSASASSLSSSSSLH